MLNDSRARLASVSNMLARLSSVVLLGLAVTCVQAAEVVPSKSKAARPELGTSAAFAADGSLLVVAKQGEQVMLYRSTDEGRSWSAPAAVNAQSEAFSQWREPAKDRLRG